MANPVHPRQLVRDGRDGRKFDDLQVANVIIDSKKRLFMEMDGTNRPVANMGIVRGISLFVCSPSLALALGIFVGYNHGWGWGVIWGLVALIMLVVYAIKMGTSLSFGEVTVWDCILPVVVSIICGITFAPVHLFAANFFSAVTCIGAGIFFSIALIMYRVGALESWALYLSMTTFLYEALPINLPTDLDDFLCFGGSGAGLIFGRIKRKIAVGIGKYVGGKAFEALGIDAGDTSSAGLLPQSDADVIDVPETSDGVEKGLSCPNCGHELSDGDIFCVMCGTQLQKLDQNNL